MIGCVFLKVNIVILRLLILLISSGLFWWGGYSWLPARRFILPTLLAISCLILTHSWWCLTMLSCMGIFCLGYGEKSQLRLLFGNGFGRGIWGLLAAICLSLALVLTHHITVILWLAYLSLNFTLENALKNVNQKIGDPIIGAGLSSVILLIH